MPSASTLTIADFSLGASGFPSPLTISRRTRPGTDASTEKVAGFAGSRVENRRTSTIRTLGESSIGGSTVRSTHSPRTAFTMTSLTSIDVPAAGLGRRGRGRLDPVGAGRGEQDPRHEEALVLEELGAAAHALHFHPLHHDLPAADGGDVHDEPVDRGRFPAIGTQREAGDGRADRSGSGPAWA